MLSIGRSRTVSMHWHTFLPDPIKPGTHVVDLGANVGRFSAEITRHFGCTCHAVEPDPRLFARIPDDPRIRRYACAIVAAPLAGRTVNFQRPSHALSGHIVMDGTDAPQSFPVQTRSLEDLVSENIDGPISLIKMDIEGAEIEILRTLPEELLRRIPQISVEFHDFCGMTPPDEVRQTAERLQALGFTYLRMSGIGHQDTLFVNRKLLPFAWSDELVTRHLTRNVRGLSRVVRRKLGLPQKG